jgi:hypothetical protein
MSQPAIRGGRIVAVDPVTDRAAFTPPPGAPGAGQLAGPRTLADHPRPPVPTAPLIKMPPPPGTVGRIKRLPSGRMYVTPSNLGQPAAVLAVTPPSINTDPPPGAGQLVQQMTDGGYVVFPLAYLGYGITSNAGDEGQINYALLQSLPQGAPVRLAPYPFLTQGPVALPSSALGASVLEGTCPVVGEAAGVAGAGIFGAVIRPQPTWTGGGLPNTGAVYLAPTVPNGGTKMFGPVLRNFWVDLRSAAVGTWGISVYGQVNHGVMQGMGIWGTGATDNTSDSIHFDQDAGAEGLNYPDGWVLDTVVCQAHGRYGLYGFMNDTLLTGVHVQALGQSTTDSGCFNFVRSNNTRLIGCRADQGLWGFIFDSNPGGNPNTPGSSATLEGCGTENIYHAALYLKNSSATGQQSRTPVLATGCSFDFAGRDGTSAAVQVDGWNLLTMWNCNITNGGGTFPQLGLKTNAVGTGPGVPSLIVIDGGIWNPAAGGAYITDSAPATTLRYRFYGAIGAIQGGGAPVNPTLQKSATWP